MLRQKSRRGYLIFFFFFFFFFLIWALFLKILTKKCQRKSILEKKKGHILGTFWSKFSKMRPYSKKKKKKKRENPSYTFVLTWFSSNFSNFNSKLFFVGCPRIFFFNQISYSLPFKKKIVIFGKIGYLKWILRVISSPKMYTLYALQL